MIYVILLRKRLLNIKQKPLPQAISTEDLPTNTRSQKSYWKYVYCLIVIEPDQPEEKSFPINDFWEKVLIFLVHVMPNISCFINE